MERELERISGTPSKAQAQEILDRALKVLYYRDKSTYNKWSIGTAEKVSYYHQKFIRASIRLSSDISDYFDQLFMLLKMTKINLISLIFSNE